MRHIVLVAAISLLFVGCVSVPAPATRSPLSPAHPAAPESTTPAATPELKGEVEAPKVAIEPTPAEREPAGPAATYTCPMHPAVRSDQPGSCTICGMALVKKEQPR
ncbi:MAG: hypothetical protein KJ067_24540 [Vicinamibacteria bacterium]|jgi:hypothetical protein|nr:hypothetical protein [Vicinamibacteria bacterium]